MNFGIAVLVALVVCLSPSVHGGETDVIRVHADKLALTNKQIDDYLKQADLENHGFEKTEEIKYETDKDGKKTMARTVYFKVTDLCFNVGKWEAVLAQRLPKQLSPSKLSSSILDETKYRLAGRNTKSCTVVLEVHYQCSPVENSRRGLSKRAPRLCYGCIGICWAAVITYE